MHPAFVFGAALAVVLGGILLLRWHPFVALIAASFLAAALAGGSALEAYAAKKIEKGDWTSKTAEAFVESHFAERVTSAFGSTAAKIGILIALASIVGAGLARSGAAERIVDAFLSVAGPKWTGPVFVVTGFLLAIPVFFDTVFLLMIPLGQAAARRANGNYVFYVLTIFAGATMAHSLVPPTPGPLVVMQQLGIDFFTMTMTGLAVGGFAGVCGIGFAYGLSRFVEVPVPPAEDFSDELGRESSVANEKSPSRRAADPASAADPVRRTPPLWLSLVPLLLPLALIASATSVEWSRKAAGEGATSLVARLGDAGTRLEDAALLAGDKNFALFLAALVSIGLALRYGSRGSGRKSFLADAVTAAGSIVLITAAGGALGATIEEAGMSSWIAGLMSDVPPMLILPTAFLVTALIRTAQGSATVAMMTSVSLFQALAAEGNLEFHPVYLAMAIGSGSKPISWMADSGFWVICRMSGMNETQGLKTVSPMSLLMGIAGLVATLVGAWAFPMR